MTYKKRGRARGGEGNTAAPAEPAPAGAPAAAPAAPGGDIEGMIKSNPLAANGLSMATSILGKDKVNGLMTQGENMLKSQGGIEGLASKAAGMLQGQSGGPLGAIGAAAGQGVQGAAGVQGAPGKRKKKKLENLTMKKLQNSKSLKRLNVLKYYKKLNH